MARPRFEPPEPGEVSNEPLAEAVAALLGRRGLSVAALGSLLRAEGLGISAGRLSQLCSGTGAAPSPEQVERLASVLGVSPRHFAEYRLWELRAMLDPRTVGFDRALAHLQSLRGLLEPPAEGIRRAPARYPRQHPRTFEERG